MQKEPYSRNQPCNNCPYRMDAPRRHWAKEEFSDLLANETSELGAVYACHKKDGCTCIGWLMMQDKNDFPSIALRISLSRHKVTREYLDSLKSPGRLFTSVRAMVRANYPELLK